MESVSLDLISLDLFHFIDSVDWTIFNSIGMHSTDCTNILCRQGIYQTKICEEIVKI